MSKQYAHLHTTSETSVKFQNDWQKNVGGVALTRHPLMVRPDFFYFLVLRSADPFFLKTRIKIKVTLICFIFIFSADLNFPLQNEIKVD